MKKNTLQKTTVKTAKKKNVSPNGSLSCIAPEKGRLKKGEVHPSAYSALEYIKALSPEKLCMWKGALEECAKEGNRSAEVCAWTVKRILDEKPVTEIYMLGLAWMIFRKDLKASIQYSDK